MNTGTSANLSFRGHYLPVGSPFKGWEIDGVSSERVVNRCSPVLHCIVDLLTVKVVYKISVLYLVINNNYKANYT